MIQSVNVTSGYGRNTSEPFVEMKVPKRRLQMSPENARDLALNLLQASEAAYTDAFLIEFLTIKIGIDKKAAVAMLAEFREWREQKQDW